MVLEKKEKEELLRKGVSDTPLSVLVVCFLSYVFELYQYLEKIGWIAHT